jgi:sRNA-binding regulator protein Hfq
MGVSLQMMMMQNGFVMGGVLSSFDQFRDMRLNVDNMTYEVGSAFLTKY